MLKKINRGLSRKDFEASRKVEKMYQSHLFGVSVQSSPSAEADDPSLTRRVGQARIGFVISKKISKKAVERNKIRRRLAEVIGKQLSNHNLQTSNLKIIFLVKTSILSAKIDEIEVQVKNVFEKIGAENSSTL